MFSSDEIKTVHKIEQLLSAIKGNIFPHPGTAEIYQKKTAGHFSQIGLARYRKLQHLNIQHLNRINIFAGKNNSGKTSLLEAVYLLSQLNDFNAFIELERYRGKFTARFNPLWLDKNFYEPAELSALFGEMKISVKFTKEQTSQQIERSGYISTIVADADVNGEHLSSSLHLFSNKEPERYFQKSNILCHAAFTSPYRYSEDLLEKAHALAVKERFFDDIIRFIREKIDSDLSQIQMVRIEGENRFYVHTNSSDYGFDMTKYGEGVQRVFEIALLTGYCRNGILCIDEFESAIHKSLLRGFSKFVHQLAEQFNVQIFLTTHSKECIDAFIENEYRHEDITGFSLREKEDGPIECKYVDGIRLASLLESINIDIRG
jgi:AAA15 family ATPase/GTPase